MALATPGLRFRQTMAGYMSPAGSFRTGYRWGKVAGGDVRFTATIAIADLDEFFQDPEHQALLTARLDYAGLGRRSPILAAMLTVFLLSLIGIPATGGFFAKFYVFSAALKANLVGLTIIGLANSAIASYYYLRVIVAIYMSESSEDMPVTSIPLALGAALVLSLAATIYLGVLPGRVLDYATQSAYELLR